jgi:cytosol alanyl aminopeptidase
MVGRRFCSAERGKEVEAFFRDRSAKAVGGARILAQTVEQIGQCVAVRKVQEPSVADFLRHY